MFENAFAVLKRAVSSGAASCMAAAVGIGDQAPATFACGRISLPNGAPCTEETRFDMASVTKVLSTSMVAFQAVEEGRLSLWDHVSRFFDVPGDKADMCVFHLMTHQSGLEPSLMLRNIAKSPREIVPCILRSPLVSAVGERPVYSCMGYILLAEILEQIYAEPLDRLARRLVFEPLGMTRTGYNPEPGNIAATEYDPITNKILCGVVHDENARFQGGVSGNAGVFSNLRDMCRFCAMLAQGGTLEGRRYLSPAMLQKAVRNYTPGHDVHRGLGFQLAGTPENFMGDLFPDGAFGHTGFTGTSFAVDPDTGLYAVLLSNRVHPTRNNDRIFRVRRLFHNAVYGEFSRGLSGICEKFHNFA